MSARRVFDVAPAQGAWCVRRRGATRVVARTATQREAVTRGRAIARALWARGQTAQLVVHGRDGRVRTEWTYGGDRCPPRG